MNRRELGPDDVVDAVCIVCGTNVWWPKKSKAPPACFLHSYADVAKAIEDRPLPEAPDETTQKYWQCVKCGRWWPDKPEAQIEQIEDETEYEILQSRYAALEEVAEQMAETLKTVRPPDRKWEENIHGKMIDKCLAAYRRITGKDE